MTISVFPHITDGRDTQNIKDFPYFSSPTNEEFRTHYYPPTELRESNCFICVCLPVSQSVYRWGPHVTITHDTLNLIVQSSSSGPQPQPCLLSGHQTWNPLAPVPWTSCMVHTSDIWCPLLEVCSNLSSHLLVMTSGGK